MKIIIYGLGNGREFVEKALKAEHEVIGYMDSFAHISNFNGKKFIELSHIQAIDYDYIVIAISDRAVSDRIKADLIDKYHVKKEKVVEFIQCYRQGIPYQKVDRVMQNPMMGANESYDGMVLGISHAARGINPAFLNGKVCNLAVGSQDIYYNYKTFEYCKARYPEKICNLKYMILDFFDYTYFNYDASLSITALEYYMMGGYCQELHHYAKNENFSGNLRQDMKNEGCYADYCEAEESLKEIAKVLFDDYYAINDYYNHHDFPDIDYEADAFGLNEFQKRFIIKNTKTLSKTGEIPMKMLTGNGSGTQRHQATIEENVATCKAWFDSIYSLNPDMKIYVVLIPRYKAMEDIHTHTYVGWKKEFYSIIDEMRNEYEFDVIDYKRDETISGNSKFYMDFAHLNYSGACAFTSLLNSDIERSERNIE